MRMDVPRFTTPSNKRQNCISIAVDGMLKRRLSAETFEAILRSELLPEEEQQRRRWDVFVDFVKKLNPLRRENRYDKKDDNQQNHQQ